MKNNFEFILKATGIFTSPNHPGRYPNNLDKTEIIEVESGKILRLEFTSFAVWVCDGINTCSCDFVKITDGDGTTLMDNSCGFSDLNPSYSWYFLPPIITTRSNRVDIFFHTNTKCYDGDSNCGSYRGWSLRWTAMTTGVKALSFRCLRKENDDVPPRCDSRRRSHLSKVSRKLPEQYQEN